MHESTNAGTELDCVIIGHYDMGFAAHEKIIRSKGLNSGDYRNLRMDYITIDNQKFSYLDVLNHLTGQQLHWTEMTQVAPVYLSSYLRKRGFNVDFASFFPTKRAELEDLVRRAKVTALTSTLYLNPIIATEVVARVREINPRTHIVLGGPLIDNLHYHLGDDDFRYVLDDIGADTYVLERQGEETLANILRCMKAGDSLSKVRNCYIRRDKQFVFTGKEPAPNNLEGNSIEWDFFEQKALGPTVQTRTALGCPFKCTFCDYPVRAGQWTTQSIDAVEKELHQIQARGNVKNVVFIDDTFNAPIGRFREILRMMIRNKFEFRWYSYFRCNLADQELIELMRDSGCGGVFLGIESGDASVLRNMKKMAAPEQYMRGIKLLNDAGIMSFASLIMGFPGETQQSVENTIQLINEAKPTFFRGEIWYYNQRAPIHNDRVQFGMGGDGYNWHHATMDWEGACDSVLRLYKGVTESSWLPMYDIDFWIIPYLRGKGMSLEQIKKFVELCNQCLTIEAGLQNGNPLPDKPIVEEQLRNYCSQLSFE